MPRRGKRNTCYFGWGRSVLELMTGDISSVFFFKLSEPVRGITIFAGGTNGRRSLFLKASYKSAWRTRQPLRFDRYTSRQPLEESS